MTISTEKLKQRIDSLRKQAADVKWVSPDAAQEMLETVDALSELLSVREAQPVTGDCDPEVYKNGKSVCLVDVPKYTAENICRSISEATGFRVDWHYIGGRVHIKALAHPAVLVSFDMLADAVKHVTGGIRIEFSANADKGHHAVPFMNFNSLSRIVEMFRAAPLEPAVPDERHPVGGDKWGWDGEYNRGWNACRAAMLSHVGGGNEKVEPVSSGYKLVPVEPTEAMLLVLGMTGSFESMRAKYKHMLAVAPDEIDMFVDQVCGDLPKGHQL